MAVITISRGTMSGGKKLASMLAERLGYECVSREVILKTASAYGIPGRDLSEAIQKGPSFFQKLTCEKERYLAYIQAILCEYADHDNLIYHGHAGHWLLQGVSHVLRVRIVASIAYRVRAAKEEFGFSEKEAMRYIKRVDRDRVKWTQFLYGQDWSSPALYDIVFNLERSDLAFVCGMVQHAVQQSAFQTTSSSAKAMHDLLTASRVRATLAGIPLIRLEPIQVRADGGSVVVRGRTRSQEMSDTIQRAAAEVPGVDHVESHLEVDYRSYRIE